MVLVAAACGRSDCPQPTPTPLFDGGVGEPCNASTQCVAGLDCRRIYGSPYPAESFGTGACTVSCSVDVSCAAGVCATLDGSDGGTFQVCLPGCSADSDCTGVGVASSRCIGARCQRLSCTADDQCPTGARCEVPGVVCCPSGSGCGFTGTIPGYCRQK